MRKYDELLVDTVDEADLFMPGMSVLLGDDAEEWTVDSIIPQTTGRILITVHRD